MSTQFSLRGLLIGVTFAAIAVGLLRALLLGAPRVVVYGWMSLAGVATGVFTIRMAFKEPSIVAAGLLLLIAFIAFFVATFPWYVLLTSTGR